MPVDGIVRATDFSIEELVLIGTTGTPVDLRGVFYELNLHEDLFSNTMSGSLLINDTNNIINLLPIIGMEFLLVTLSKPSSPLKIQKVFRVYKITDRRKSSASSEDYILHFCSEESIISESQKISKSYKSMSVSDMVRDICTTFLKIDEKKLPSSSITPTQGVFDVVVPYWSPFYTINWLSRMARTSQAPGCSFVFFEDSDGYNFAPIELLSQQEPVELINFSPQMLLHEKQDKTDTEIRLQSAHGYELVGSPDLIRGLNTGTFSGKLTVVDPFAQKLTVNSMNAATLFSQTKHVNPYQYIQLNQDRTKKPVTEHHNSFFRVSASALKTETWVIQRNAYLSAMHAFQVKVELPGNPTLRVGQVVTLNMPAGQSPSNEGKPIDDLYGGKYLISTVRHKIDRTQYTCTLELSKDSVKTPMPVAYNSNQTLNVIREK